MKIWIVSVKMHLIQLIYINNNSNNNLNKFHNLKKNTISYHFKYQNHYHYQNKNNNLNKFKYKIILNNKFQNNLYNKKQNKNNKKLNNKIYKLNNHYHQINNKLIIHNKTKY